MPYGRIFPVFRDGGDPGMTGRLIIAIPYRA